MAYEGLMVGVPMNIRDMLELKMQYDGERQRVLAENIANKDIPGFKAHDLVALDFKNVLASQNAKIDMKMTSPLHVTGLKPGASAFSTTGEKYPFDVNITSGDVSIEQQMMKVTQNAMDFQMSTSLYKKISSLYKEALGISASSSG